MFINLFFGRIYKIILFEMIFEVRINNGIDLEIQSALNFLLNFFLFI